MSASAEARNDQTAAAAAHLGHLRRIARRLLGCEHLADDAVQEALCALAGEATPPDNLRAWLVTTVVHRCRHLRRSVNRRHRHEHAASQHCHLHQGCDNPLHIAVAHELGEALDRAIAHLPDHQRAAFERYFHGRRDYAGIAADLGLPIGTVRSRLHRARTAVAAALSDHLDHTTEQAT